MSRLRWALWAVLLASCAPQPSRQAAPSVAPSAHPSPVFEPPVVLAPTLGGERVSLVSILADPKRWHGKSVAVAGYLHLEFEGDKFCLHRDDVEHFIYPNCLWIDVPHDNRAIDALSDRYVGLEGVFNAESHGHFGAYPGTLERVASIGALPTLTAVRNELRSQRP